LEKLDAIDVSSSTFTGFLSEDGITWNVLDSLTFPMRQPYFVGVSWLAGKPHGFAGARLTTSGLPPSK